MASIADFEIETAPSGSGAKSVIIPVLVVALVIYFLIKKR